MANLAKLKKPSGKGSPPALDQAPDNLSHAPREKTEPIMGLNLRIPQSAFEEFSQEAGRAFGFKKGAKQQLFLAMWADYKRNLGA